MKVVQIRTRPGVALRNNQSEISVWQSACSLSVKLVRTVNADAIAFDSQRDRKDTIIGIPNCYVAQVNFHLGLPKREESTDSYGATSAGKTLFHVAISPFARRTAED